MFPAANTGVARIARSSLFVARTFNFGPASITVTTLRRHQFHIWKTRANSIRIIRHEFNAQQLRMGADEEVGKGIGGALLPEAFARASRYRR